MKKNIIYLMIFIFTFFGVTAFGDTIYGYEIPVTVSVNNNIIETENGGILIEGTTYAPIRFVANALNIYDISWNEEEKSATLSFDSKTLKLFSDKNYAYLNGKKINLDNKVILKNSRTLVPLRFIAEMFDCTVEWDSTLYIANINKSDITVNESMIEKDYDKKDILWLARLIEAESSGEPFVGKIAVGNVVLNRVSSKEFPANIYDVIFDTKYGVQFQPAANNAIYNSPSRDSVIAGNIALTNHNIAGESLYFLNPKIASNFWIINNRIFYKSIYNHDFYL